MLTPGRHARFLDDLAKDTSPSNLKTNCLVLGQVVHTAFPSSSPFFTEYELLSKRVKEKKHLEPAEEFLNDFRNLARSASQYLAEFPPALAESDQQEIVQLVDRSYGQSLLFTATKWVLAISLALLGIGSLGYAGLNVFVWEKVQAAQERAADATKRLNEIADASKKEVSEMAEAAKRAQSNALKEINGGAASATKQINDMVDAAKAAQGKALQQINDLIGTQSSEIRLKFQEALTQASTQLETKVNTASATANRAAEESKAQLIAAAQKGIGDLGAVIASQSQVLAAATTKATQEITGDAQSKLRSIEQATESYITSLSNRTEKGKNDIDQALQRDVAALEAAFNQKLPALDQKSSEVAKKLDAIAAEGQLAEDQFANQLTQRLRSWDSQIGQEIDRVNVLEKSITNLKTGTDRLDQRLAGLLTNSSAALKVADRLTAGTRSGDLEKIGSILEKSATYIIVTFVLGFLGTLGLALTLVILFFQYRNRQHEHTLAPDTK
jgi:hypothetical protein